MKDKQYHEDEELEDYSLDPMEDYEDLLDNDEISAAEEGFMRGWGET